MKVLIVAYYWPPAGGPGVQRWLNFVKYLPNHGITPIVYVPENPEYPIIDDDLVSDVPEGVEVIKQPIVEPYKWASLLSKQSTKTISSGVIPEKEQSLVQRLLLYIRGNFFIPDARKFWIKPSVTFLDTYIKEHAIDLLITTGPPHSLHLIGQKLSKRLSIPWISDFRDPWTTIGYHNKLKLSNRAQKKHKTLEKLVLDDSDTIIVTSPTTKKEFEQLTNTPITVITNGFEAPKWEPSEMLDTAFTLSHIGSLLSGRNPVILWEVLQELLSEIPGFKNDFKLQLIGTVSNVVMESIEKYRLKNHTSVLGYVSHTEALKYQQASQVLLLIEIDESYTKCIVPGKLFEYLLANRPIIGIGPEGADFKTIISETNAGSHFNYNDKDKLKTTLIHYYNLYKEQQLVTHSKGIEKYSREYLTKTLAKVIMSYKK